MLSQTTNKYIHISPTRNSTSTIFRFFLIFLVNTQYSPPPTQKKNKQTKTIIKHSNLFLNCHDYTTKCRKFRYLDGCNYEI